MSFRAEKIRFLVDFSFVSQYFGLGPDYMSRAGPVSRAALVWADPVVTQGARTICLGSRLLFYSKCTRFTVFLTYSHISLTVYINQ